MTESKNIVRLHNLTETVIPSSSGDMSEDEIINIIRMFFDEDHPGHIGINGPQEYKNLGSFIKSIKNPTLKIQEAIFDYSQNNAYWLLDISPDQLHPTIVKILLTHKQLIFDEDHYNFLLVSLFSDNHLLMNKWMRYAEHIKATEHED